MAEREAVDDVLELISRAMYSTLLGGAEYWAKLDITMPQLKVLMLLGLHGGAPVSWLASQMEVSPPNVTGILDRLSKEEWIVRTSDPNDRRVVRVVLTEKGQKLLRDLQAAGQDRVRETIAEMRASDRTALRQGLSALLERAESPPSSGGRRRRPARGTSAG